MSSVLHGRYGVALRAGSLVLALLTALPSHAYRFASTQAASAAASQDDLRSVRVLLEQGKFSVAEAELRNRIATTPEDAEAEFLLGFALFKEGRAKDSLAAYTEGAKTRRPTPDEFVVIASDYILLADLADAQKWLTVATSEAPRSVSAWYLLGRTEYQLDHPDKARDAFLTCLRLAPTDVRAEYNLGLAYARLQQPEKAIEAYQQAIRMNSSATHPDPQPYLDLGILLLGQNKASEALPLLQKAASLAPRNPAAHEQVALCLEKLGRDAEAAAEMLTCVQLAPDVAAPSFFLGRIYRRLGRTADAKVQFDRAARLSGTHSSKEVPNPSPDM